MRKRNLTIDGTLYIRADLVSVDEVNMQRMAERIISAVASVHGHDPGAIRGVGRRQPLPKLRAAVILLMVERGYSWVAIGRELRRNHSTVIACANTYQENEWVTNVALKAREKMDGEKC